MGPRKSALVKNPGDGSLPGGSVIEKQPAFFKKPTPCSLKKDMTVEDAFKRIRRIGGDMETINILYVTAPTRHLLGVLSVRDLLLAEEDDLIEEIMDRIAAVLR